MVIRLPRKLDKWSGKERKDSSFGTASRPIHLCTRVPAIPYFVEFLQVCLAHPDSTPPMAADNSFSEPLTIQIP